MTKRLSSVTAKKLFDRSDVICLIKSNQTQDELGVWHDHETSREVFCHVQSTTTTEWYAAEQSGMRATWNFILFGDDYEGEDIVEYDGERFSVLRTYMLEDGNIELHTGTKKGTDHE